MRKIDVDKGGNGEKDYEEEIRYIREYMRVMAYSVLCVIYLYNRGEICKIL